MRKVTEGTWKNHLIRRARKAHTCDYYRGRLNGGRCGAKIAVGDDYMEGEMNDDAGGFGHDRYCLECAGPEARAAAYQERTTR